MSDGAATDTVTVDQKRLDTLKARAALAGWSLHRMPDGDLIVTRWGRSIELPDERAVEDFLAKVEGAR